ncbi:MAG TPA: hypothetical protein VGK74_22115 [Symbiobacteriaceae bacterium]
MQKGEAEALLRRVGDEVPGVTGLAVVQTEQRGRRRQFTTDYGVGYQDPKNEHIYITWARGDTAWKRLGLD